MHVAWLNCFINLHLLPFSSFQIGDMFTGFITARPTANRLASLSHPSSHITPSLFPSSPFHIISSLPSILPYQALPTITTQDHIQIIAVYRFGCISFVSRFPSTSFFLFVTH